MTDALSSSRPLPKRPILFLSGPPGVGKSSVGPLIAKRLGVPFYDLDEEIETRSGSSINEWVNRKGWDHFREYEAACLDELCDEVKRGDHADLIDQDVEHSLLGVISLGGGTLLRDDSFELTLQVGIMITLWASLPLLQSRLIRRQHQKRIRPLPIKSNLASLIQDRFLRYRACDIWLDCYEAETAYQLEYRIHKAYKHRLSMQANPNPSQPKAWYTPPFHLEVLNDDQSDDRWPEVSQTESPSKLQSGDRPAFSMSSSLTTEENKTTLLVTGYPVFFHRDAETLLADHIELTLHEHSYHKVVILSDDIVARLYAGSFVGALQLRGLDAHLLSFPQGEKSKRLRVVEALTSELLKLKIGRRDLLIAFGGGVTGDLGGLIASVYLRGIDWLQIPTTLLAQVDSSVGAKTAVNHPLGKNLIGTFYRPKWVWIDAEYLSTLPLRQLRAGWVEAIKHGLIADLELLEQLTESISTPADLQGIIWSDILPRCVSVKARLVEEDEHEHSLRVLLNLGHTFGHGFEHQDQTLLHGEAIALGLVFTLEYAHYFSGLSIDDATKVIKTLAHSGLLIDWRSRLNDQVWQAIELDKKRSGDSVFFITLSALGQAEIETLTVTELRERGQKLASFPPL